MPATLPTLFHTFSANVDPGGYVWMSMPETISPPQAPGATARCAVACAWGASRRAKRKKRTPNVGDGEPRAVLPNKRSFSGVEAATQRFRSEEHKSELQSLR